MDALAPLARGHADLVELLDRRAALDAALGLLVVDGDVAWMAEPASDGGYLVLRRVRGDRTGLLRGLRVPRGLGLTGKVHGSGGPAWVDDYFRSTDITHTFDGHIEAEAVRRLLAVPVRRHGRPLGVLAVGARTDGAFGDRAVARAGAVADHAALAVAVAERARLAREVAVHEERSRIAAELHDSVGALLFAIGSGVAGLAETADGDPELTDRLERLRRQADEASTALRDSLRTLRASPAALALSVALRADCTAFADRTGVPAELVVLDDVPPDLPRSRHEVLVAAVREALLNVEKHAAASAVVVTAGRRPRGGVVVAVTDDGVGLPPDHVPGLGLTSTADAVGRLGGTVRVVSDPDGGTTWRIDLPC
ncbi:GAF domain-containing sensor histidine kinase [Pseudonocardia abyssalis]|uniref:GAF domain-containing protein n=1 Tax=Pseudonocardia abyssalis TaxID=2792008 RepID=A0ABS6UPT2_9PSEU|nr:histidine kinase [Pseudonocardia abyssalis]MBW0115216.1 GAF domain-containing protein [Pseudonocardia abyssalis]MBW0133918.1 GAF domain-containing protein [Pseudonocardia abyssalis]